MSRTKRIAVLSHSFLRNDPRVNRAVNAFLADGWTVDGLFLDDSSKEGRLNVWRVPIARAQGSLFRYAFEYGVFFVWAFFWLLWRCLVAKPDVVFVNSPPDAFSLAALPCRMLGSHVVLDVHDPMPELLLAKGRSSGLAHWLLTAQERLGLKAASSVMTVHEPLADLINERVPDADFSIVMNVPDLDSWSEIDWDSESRTLLYAGTVAVRYGIDDVIRAVAELHDEVPDLRFKVIGDGEDLDGLGRLAADLGVADRVEFTGRVPYAQVRAMMDGAWLGVNLPKPDGLGELSFSNKVVEWAGIGLPVLAARTRTMLRYFPEGTLTYADGGDPVSITGALRECHNRSVTDWLGHIEGSRDALSAIGWDIQRTSLLDVVNDSRLA